MAGRNAAVNLTGMLRDATGSLRRGLTVDGRSAGDAFADSFHNAMAPDSEDGRPGQHAEVCGLGAAGRQGRDRGPVRREGHAGRA
jgi:hypothetical protein